MMNWLLKLVTGNPLILLWIVGGAFAAGAITGAGGAWTVQGYRLDAVKAEFSGFKGIVKAQGEAAAKEAARVNLVNSRAMEAANHEYAKVKGDLAKSYADYRKLRNSTPSRPVPSATPVASGSDRTCYKSRDITGAVDSLEKSVFGGFDRLDAAVPSVIEQGDTFRTRLQGSMKWAESLAK